MFIVLIFSFFSFVMAVVVVPIAVSVLVIADKTPVCAISTKDGRDPVT